MQCCSCCWRYMQPFRGKPRLTPDLIVHHAKIVTADPQFSFRQAMAVKDGKIISLGTDEQNPRNQRPEHPVARRRRPHASSRPDRFARSSRRRLHDRIRSSHSADGIDRDVWLTFGPAQDRRRGQLDRASSRSSSPGCASSAIPRGMNSTPPPRKIRSCFPPAPTPRSTRWPLNLSGIDKDFKVDRRRPRLSPRRTPQTGEPTGILRGCTRYVKSQADRQSRPPRRTAIARPIELFKDYNSDRPDRPSATATPSRTPIARYRKMRDARRPDRPRWPSPITSPPSAPLESIETSHPRASAKAPLRKDDPMLRMIGIKTYLDGGMLTGSAYMREPWGVSKIYSIKDPKYRGVLFIPKERLLPMVRAAIRVRPPIHRPFRRRRRRPDAARHLRRTRATRMPPAAARTRPCITHCNFVEPRRHQASRQLGVVADIQPAWLYLDTRTLDAQFGYDRLALVPAPAQPVRGRRHHRRRLRPHAKDRLPPGDQSYNPFLGMDDRHPQRPLVR